MYFNKSIKSLILSYRVIKDWRFLLLGALLAVFGASFQSFEFFRLHDISQILTFSVGIKLIYLIWQVFSWIMSLLLGSIIFPAFILMVQETEVKHNLFQFKTILKQAREMSYKYIVLLFTYYNMLFIIAGGGFLVAVAGLVNNIYYNKGIITIFDLKGNIPLVASFITIGIIASTFIALLFNIVSQILVIEDEGVVGSIIGGLKLINHELPYILTAWIVLNIGLLFPMILLSLMLHFLYLATSAPGFFRDFGLIIGLIIFFIFYTIIASITNVYWTQIYLNIKGKINLSNLAG